MPVQPKPPPSSYPPSWSGKNNTCGDLARVFRNLCESCEHYLSNKLAETYTRWLFTKLAEDPASYRLVSTCVIHRHRFKNHS